MLFQKKLNNFLLKAKQENIINEKTFKELSNFAVNSNKNTILNRLNLIIYTIGGIFLVLGLILLISSNWQNISSFVKILVYLLILSGTYAAALKTKNNNLSNILFFVESGFVLAGIGLVAQIFHLSSPTGSAFLLWFILILPLAIVVKFKWLNLMCLFAFYLWLTTYLNYREAFYHNIIMYFSIFLGNIYLFAEHSKNNEYWFLKKIVFIITIVSYYILLLSGNNHMNFHFEILGFALFLANIVGIAYFMMTKKQNIQEYILIAILLLLPLFAYFECNIFNILLNILWIVLPIFAIKIGIEKLENSYINTGSFLLFLYITTKFFDYFKTMLLTGNMFVASGIIFIIFAFSFEKIRKKLISYGKNYEKR